MPTRTDPEHPFDRCLGFNKTADGVLTGMPPKAYWNMVGPFGGMTASILLAGVMRDNEVIGEPLVLTVNFCAPVLDRDYMLQVRNVRTNRSTQHWHVEMIQVDAEARVCVAQATVVTGVRRDAWSQQSLMPPNIPAPTQCAPRPGRENIAWFDRFDMRFGHDPMTEREPEHPAHTWVRDAPPRPLDHLSLANRCDALFPAIFAHRQRIDPIATVSFNVYFHASQAALESVGDDFTLGVSRTNIHSAGFADSEAWVWANDRLIATTQQLMWYRTD